MSEKFLETSGQMLRRDEYIRSLESLLIFMCKTYEKQHDELLGLMKAGNDAFLQISTVQGSVNVIGISQIASLEFDSPTHGFRDVYMVMRDKNTSLSDDLPARLEEEVERSN